ncbi:MAG TPA: hypothetical protein VFZ08_15590 [Terriglobia bacterium]|nr:hypothetical protein [Terriglobia bacterium]
MRVKLLAAFLLCASSAAYPQATTPKPDRLVTARLLYVAPMPQNIDKWLIEDLRAWGKYQISGNSQGVDLVLRAKARQTTPRVVIRNGVPVQPKPGKTPPVLSIALVDWVTGTKLWQADIMDKNRKRNQNPSPGPDTEIDARHMTPDQIAQRCATLLREYVAQLEEKK